MFPKAWTLVQCMQWIDMRGFDVLIIELDGGGWRGVSWRFN